MKQEIIKDVLEFTYILLTAAAIAALAISITMYFTK